MAYPPLIREAWCGVVSSPSEAWSEGPRSPTNPRAARRVMPGAGGPPIAPPH